MIKNCLNCSKEFEAKSWLIKKGYAKYCTHKCYQIAEKGRLPWNKGTKEICKPNSGSFKKGKPKYTGTMKNYKALHAWVNYHLGKPQQCNLCGDETSRLEYANRSYKYKRDLTDWFSLCVKCHRNYDKGSYDRGLTC